MMRSDIIKEHQSQYEDYGKKIKGMTGLEREVAEKLILPWIKGIKWMGGISDKKFTDISEKIIVMGYDIDDIMNEFDRQVALF